MSSSKEEEKYLSTPLDEIPKIVDTLREHFNKNAPFSYEFRMQQLEQLEKLVNENETEILEACADYFKEDIKMSVGYRLFPVKYDLGLMMTSLKDYMKPKSVKQPFPMNVMWSANVEYHGRGVVGIIAPWNFPVSLLLRPLIGAIAAGNCVVLKPSEVTDNVARLLAKLIPKYLDRKIVQVICGGPKETNAMISAKLDLCMFTGSTFVGKLIMKACAEHLTPVILELGGKNPVFIDDNIDLSIVAKRIMFGRLMNCGQLCLSPEYLFVSKRNVATLVEQLRKTLKDFYGNQIETTNRFSHIVNSNHFKRLKKIRDHYLLDEQEAKKVVIGGPNDKDFFFQDNEKERFMPPMVLTDVDFYKDFIMADEVFGPFLSIIPMQGKSDEWIKEAINMVQSKPKPLACYIFSERDAFVNTIKDRVSGGAIVTNDTVFHMALKDVPFGGVGESGCGHYGGYNSFVSFSHEKPFAKRIFGLEAALKDRYPNGQVEKLAGRLGALIPRPKSTQRIIVEYGFKVAVVGISVHFALKKFANFDVLAKFQKFYS